MSRFVLVSAIAAVAALAACGGSSKPSEVPDFSTNSPSTKTAADAGPAPDKTATQAAALESLTAEEGKKNACDEGHKAALEKLLADVEATMKAKTGEDGKPLGFQLVGKRIVPLGNSAAQSEMSVTGRGTDVHVLAFGAKDVSLDVLVGNSAATTMRSPFQHSATANPPSLDIPKVGTVTEVQTDSREVQIKPGAPLVIKLSGQGCAAFITFLKP
ncbi:hypothetical protein AKJ09_01150 [Labilithrix luteola]|uniref:Lipoprotein n=1 Tax=Labilithrix luteola TaxID=1391654 RepID=A0A0K1PM61_9BACT|nr:hypothetical protein [Labilithrix luteola]AKU94486.1 hypothetical protein AKJ09_01150 [Labilithrix luteola]